MFGIGIPELILILIVGLVVFGPGKLPEVGRALGKGLREFKKAQNALTQAMNEQEPPAQTSQPARPAAGQGTPQAAGAAAPQTAGAAVQNAAAPQTAGAATMAGMAEAAGVAGTANAAGTAGTANAAGQGGGAANPFAALKDAPKGPAAASENAAQPITRAQAAPTGAPLAAGAQAAPTGAPLAAGAQAAPTGAPLAAGAQATATGAAQIADAIPPAAPDVTSVIKATPPAVSKGYEPPTQASVAAGLAAEKEA